ncbi:hypothetical protein [Sphingomonas sp.]|jgi:hypothetical protein|uniref:TolB family protein n=1 Tax=Sphingomonas sp. TaxID=28214 RepID=UPI002DEF64D3|nr:hypothetical protein [Sphingomonas sp.]
MNLLLLFAAAQMIEAASSPLNDYNYSTDGFGRRAVFARSEADFRNARILVAERRNGRWQAAKPIGFSHPLYSDTDPWLTPDGRTLYFVSDRPLPAQPDRRDLNIWRSVHRAGKWGAPEPLGPEVNSSGPELGPELLDGVLYFSSVRKGGSGGLDIYAARKQGSGFSAAAPLAGPFNTPESDSDFTISRNGRLAALWRGSGATAKIHVSSWKDGGWTTPVPLDADINFGPFTFTPSLSADGKRLRFASTAVRPGQEPGLADIYEAPIKLPR